MCWQCKRCFARLYKIDAKRYVCWKCKTIYYPDIKPLAKLVNGKLIIAHSPLKSELGPLR